MEKIMLTSKSTMMSLMVVLTVGALFLACGSSTDSDSDQADAIVARSVCGGYVAAKLVSTASEDETCVQWNYSADGIFSFTHFNAGLNCCTDVVASFDRQDSVITVQIVESGDYCHCLCLFDIDYNLGAIPAGTYTVIIQESYLPEGDEALTFVVNLSGEANETYCVDRTMYPWETSTTASGELVGDASCKAGALSDTADGLTCLAYDYDDGTLSLTHYNAVLNCCPVLTAEFDIRASEIVITEIDSLHQGGCDCVCRYDLNYLISNLLPGEYAIKVIEPYMPAGEDTLQGTINLYFDHTGSFCVDRDLLP
jgi:hypothetical protein